MSGLEFTRTYRKLKQRRILVLSAGGEQSGIQALYFIVHGETWEIMAKTFVPYPQKIGELIESCRRQPVAMSDLAWLESRVTLLSAECAKAALAGVPRGLRKPHLTVLKQLSLYKGPVGDGTGFPRWNVTVGDPEFIATTLDLPVISGLCRSSLLAGGRGAVPLLAGNLRIARRYKGIVAFVNIGLISRMTVIDPAAAPRCIIDSDTGPGMCLINRCAREVNCPDGFDRDGSESAKGAVHAETLDSLANAPWFLTGAPKEASTDIFDQLLRKPLLSALPASDRLTTVTALTARTIYDFFRREYKEKSPPEAVVISGGGTNNLSLRKFLATYFGHVAVVSCEDLGIPAETRIPLALGLSVDAGIRKNAALWEDGAVPGGLPGRLTLP